MGNRFKRMYEFPLQDVNYFCKKCTHLRSVYDDKINGSLTFKKLGDLRVRCTKCRGSWSNQKSGIYKADAILGAYKPTNTVLPKGKGRSSVIPKTVIQAILRQAESGLTYKEIKENTGYSVATISRVVKRNKQD